MTRVPTSMFPRAAFAPYARPIPQQPDIPVVQAPEDDNWWRSPPRRSQPRQPKTYQDVTPEEESGVLGNILSAVGAVGNVLDLPGSSIRDALALRNPFDQWLSPMTFENRTTGRELLDMAGITRKNKPGMGITGWDPSKWDWGEVGSDVAGFAGEVALDPLTWIGLGPAKAGTAIGRAASAQVTKMAKFAKAGKLANMVDEAGKLAGDAFAKAGDDAARTTAQKAVEAAGEAAVAAKGGKADDAIRAVGRALELTDPASAGHFYDLAGHHGLITEAVIRGTERGILPEAFLSGTPTALAHQFRTGARDLIGIRAPFAKAPMWSWGGGGKTGEAMAKAVEWMAYSDKGLSGLVTSPIRGARGLFSASAGRHSPEFLAAVHLGRDIATSVAESKMGHIDGVTASMIEGHNKIRNAFNEATKHLIDDDVIAKEVLKTNPKALDEVFDDFMRQGVEWNLQGKGLQEAGALRNMLFKRMREGNFSPENVPAGAVEAIEDSFGRLAEAQTAMKNAEYKEARKYGWMGEEIHDLTIEHDPRSGAHTNAMEMQRARAEALSHVPGGTAWLNRAGRGAWWNSTEALRKTPEGILENQKHHEQMRKWVQKHGVEGDALGKRGDVTPEGLQRATLLHNIVMRGFDERWPGGVATLRDGTKQLREEALDLWKNGPWERKVLGTGEVEMERGQPLINKLQQYLAHRPKKTLGTGIYDQGYIDDNVRYMEGAIRHTADVKGLHGILRGKGVLKNLGTDDALEPIAGIWEASRLHERGLEQLMRDMKLDKGAYSDLGVDPSTAQAIKTYMQGTDPRTASGWSKALDRVRAAWAGPLTTPWPAFHARNLGSGFYQMLSHGKINAKQIADGQVLAAQYIWSGGKKGLSKDFVEWVQKAGLLKGTRGRVGLSDVELVDAARRLPENLRESFGQSVRSIKTLKGNDPRAFRGVLNDPDALLAAGKVENLNAIASLGEDTYSAVEFTLRAGYAHSLLEAGYTHGQVTHLVREAHFDYNALSAFEKSTVRKVGPLFYGWARKSMPFTFKKMLRRPGGMTAQTFRAYSQAQRENKPYTPAFIRESTGIPLGTQDKEGYDVFLGSLGIPIEDVDNYFAVKGQFPYIKPGRTMEKMAAQLNPLVVTPMENLADKEFWTGRKLDYLRSPSEEWFGKKLPWFDRGIAKGPFRIVTEGRKVADVDRKGVPLTALNVLTGLKFSSYDTEKWRTIDLTNELRRLGQDDPMVREHTFQYIPEKYKDVVDQTIVDRAARIRELETVLARRREAEKKKKKAKK